MLTPAPLRLVGLAALLVLLASCNLPGSVQEPAPDLAGGATLTPPSTPLFETAGPEALSEYFFEDFLAGLPEGWQVDEGWEVEAGVLRGEGDGASLSIPGQWQDVTLFARLRLEGEGGALRLHESESGAYLVEFAPGGLAVLWEPPGAEQERLAEAELEIDSDWHDLVVRAFQGRIEVLLDGEARLEAFNADSSTRGALGVLKSGQGVLEIERLAAAPPQLGPDALTPTPQPLFGQTPPPGAATDLAVAEIGVDEGGELFALLTNLGPQPLEQASLLAAWTVSDAGGEALEGSPFETRLGLSLAVNETLRIASGLDLDLPVSGYTVSLALTPLDYADSGPSNNSLSVALSPP